MSDHLECLDANPECSGPVEYRMPLSGTGKSFPRCDHHWDKRLEQQAGINRRYPNTDVPPSDFDPMYAGERRRMVPEAVIDKKRLAEVQKYDLLAGGHGKNSEGQMCIMEAVAYVAGEAWSDNPKCASRILASFMRQLNDRLSDEKRQELKPYIERMIGTRDGRDEERSWLISDWSIRVALPAWLELSGQVESAEKLRSLPQINLEVFAENRRWLLEIREEAWQRRMAWRKRVKGAVQAELKKRGVADADAVAAAAAVAAADAAAVSVAVAAVAADAVAASVAAAASVADAAAVAVSVAVADAAAAAAAAGLAYGSARRNQIYEAVKAKLKPKYQEAVKPTSDALWPTALELIENLIDLDQEKAEA